MKYKSLLQSKSGGFKDCYIRKLKNRLRLLQPNTVLNILYMQSEYLMYEGISQFVKQP